MDWRVCNRSRHSVLHTWARVSHPFNDFVPLELSFFRSGHVATYPATSLTTSRTKAVRLLRWPLVRETRGLTTRGVVFYTWRRKKSTKCQRPSSASATGTASRRTRGQRSRDPPRGETLTTRTWPRFRPTVRPVLAGASLAIFVDW